MEFSTKKSALLCRSPAGVISPFFCSALLTEFVFFRKIMLKFARLTQR